MPTNAMDTAKSETTMVGIRRGAASPTSGPLRHDVVQLGRDRAGGARVGIQ
jgi:hypothetical protein